MRTNALVAASRGRTASRGLTLSASRVTRLSGSRADIPRRRFNKARGNRAMIRAAIARNNPAEIPAVGARSNPVTTRVATGRSNRAAPTASGCSIRAVARAIATAHAPEAEVKLTETACADKLIAAAKPMEIARVHKAPQGKWMGIASPPTAATPTATANRATIRSATVSSITLASVIAVPETAQKSTAIEAIIRSVSRSTAIARRTAMHRRQEKLPKPPGTRRSRNRHCSRRGRTAVTARADDTPPAVAAPKTDTFLRLTSF